MLNSIVPLFSGGAAAIVGDFDSIATVTVGAGGSANVEFTSISGTYKHLQIRFISRGTDSANNNIGLQFNSDTATNYSSHALYGDGSSAAALAETSAITTQYISNSNSSRLANSFSGGIIDILDYSNTNKNKTIRTLSGREDNTNGILLFQSGLWRSTSAITSIKIFAGAGNLAQYSHFALYGVKG